MIQIGTAVGSNDISLIPFLRELKKEKLLDYIELYILPMVSIDELAKWRETEMVKFCQAPHDDRAGFRLDYLNIGLEAAKILDVKNIIYNAGVSELDIMSIPDNCWPENMPYRTSLGDLGIYVTPDDIAPNFCCDIAHSWITARQIGSDAKFLLKKFIEKNPKHLHITDVKSEEDHVPLGTGDIDLGYVVDLIKDFPCVTMETDHEKPNRINIMREDLKVFKKYYENRNNYTG